MGDFKLLAIRPLKGCHIDYRKVLNEDEIYKFYNEYDFTLNENKEVIRIESKSSVPLHLYKIKTPNGSFKDVNISAIVGKNGSGKSSILELLFLSMYVISTKEGILTPNLDFLNNAIKKANEQKNKVDLKSYKAQKKQLEYIYDKFKAEIYYKIKDDYYCMRIDKNSTYQILIKGSKIAERNYKIKLLFDEKIDFNEFFYSIAINYSFYSLNSVLIGDWIKTLFHKNDGYKTPVVINPFRDKGNIDINTEIYLAKQRLLSNILKPIEVGNDTHRKLTEHQKVESISFSINREKIKYAFIKHSGLKEVEIGFNEISYETNKNDAIEKVCEIFFVKSIPIKKLNKVKNSEEIKNYIIKKLIRIARTYPYYQDYFKDEAITAQKLTIGKTETKLIKLPPNRFENFEIYIKKLYKDESHITYKLRQAINYMQYDILHNDINGNWIERKKLPYQFKISVNHLSERIQDISSKQMDVIYLIPPSLFNIEIHLDNIDTKDKKSKSLFSQLSSGEQQLIHSIQTILYHINNVNSVFKDDANGDNKIKYKYINLILDEIELYFHPDYQRKFISSLLENLESLNVSNIEGYNILFSTHSPFILSDIPAVNTLKLVKGNSEQYDANNQTFGANIHDLLANDFFMPNGCMGEFAQKKINKVIDLIKGEILTDEKEINNISEIINLIGEPIIKSRLNKILIEKYPAYIFSDDDIDRKIKIQTEILKQLEFKKRNRG